MTSTPTITVSAGAPSALAGAVVVLDARVDDAILERFDAVIAAANALPNNVTDYRPLRDATITQLMLKQAELRDAIASRGVLLGGEIAHRSRPELGLQGLAQRNGFGTAKKMVQHVGRETPTNATTTITTDIVTPPTISHTHHGGPLRAGARAGWKCAHVAFVARGGAEA